MSSEMQNRLNEIPQYYQNAGWLQVNAEELFGEVVGALKSDVKEESSDAVRELLRVYPYVIHHSDVKRWSKLLQDALMSYEKKYPNPGINANSRVTQLFLTAHEGDEVIEAEFAVALKRARKRIRPAMILEAYTNLLRKYVFHQSKAFDRGIIRSALTLARQVNDQEAYARLYLSLAYVFIYLGETEKALEYGRMAHAYWTRIGDEYEIALSTYLMATVCTRNNKLDEALTWLERSDKLFNELNRPEYRGYVAYETMMIHTMKREFEPAHEWVLVALQEVKRIESDYARSTFEHAAGILKARIGELDAGRALLESSIRYWRGNKDAHNVGHTLHSMAYVEGLAGNKDVAFKHLDEAQELLSSLQENARRTQILNAVNELREAIANNADLTAL